MATIIGVFSDSGAAQEVLDDLQLNGFSATDSALVTLERAQGGDERRIEEQLAGYGVAREFTPEYVERLRQGALLLVVRATGEQLPTVQTRLRRASPQDIDILPDR